MLFIRVDNFKTNHVTLVTELSDAIPAAMNYAINKDCYATVVLVRVNSHAKETFL